MRTTLHRQLPDRRQQFALVEILFRDVGARAEVETAPDIRRIGARGHQDHRNGCETRVHFDRLKQPETIHPRHFDIGDHHIDHRLAGAQDIQCVNAVDAEQDAITLRLEDAFLESSGRDRIVDHQDRRGVPVGHARPFRKAETRGGKSAFVAGPMLHQQFGRQDQRRNLVVEHDGSGHQLADADSIDIAHQHGANIVERIRRERAIPGAMSYQHGLYTPVFDRNLRIRRPRQCRERDYRHNNVLARNLDPCGRTSLHTFQRIGAKPQQPLDPVGGKAECSALRLGEEQRLARRRERHVQQGLRTPGKTGSAAGPNHAVSAQLRRPRRAPCPVLTGDRQSAAVEKPGANTRREAGPSAACARPPRVRGSNPRSTATLSIRARSGPRPSSRMLIVKPSAPGADLQRHLAPLRLAGLGAFRRRL